MSTFDLAWGEPICVREELDAYWYPQYDEPRLKDMGYPHYDGLEKLTDHLKRILGYKHIIITNGTSVSINMVLRALARAEGREVVVTNKPYFPFYPNIIEKCGYKHKTNLLHDRTFHGQKLYLIDIPSNPYGQLMDFTDLHNNVIWDSVYANRVYVNSKTPFKIQHRVNVGSFSKWLGLTGLRIGWIATNSDSDYELFYRENLYETCGISVPSQALVTAILDARPLDTFEDRAREAINKNRGEFEKLSGFFDKQEIPINGMFFPVMVNSAGIKILERAGVKFITLENQGDDYLIRFNLAQNNILTRDAVKAIKTADRLK